MIELGLRESLAVKPGGGQAVLRVCKALQSTGRGTRTVEGKGGLFHLVGGKEIMEQHAVRCVSLMGLCWELICYFLLDEVESDHLQRWA